MPRRSTLILALALAGAGLSAAASEAVAQLPQLEVMPKAGIFIPASSLGAALEDVELVQIKVELQTGFTAGFNLQYNLPTAPASLRLSFDYVPFTEAEAAPTACGVIESPYCVPVAVDARFFALTADAVIRPRGEPRRPHGFFVIGLGAKHYEFADLECPAGDEGIVCRMLDDFTRNQWNLTVHVGVGLAIRLGSVHAVLELSDYMSQHDPASEDAEGKVQQDLFLTAGVRIGLL